MNYGILKLTLNRKQFNKLKEIAKRDGINLSLVGKMKPFQKTTEIQIVGYIEQTLPIAVELGIAYIL